MNKGKEKLNSKKEKKKEKGAPENRSKLLGK